MDKLEIEFSNAKVNHLRYLAYDTFLIFENITIDEHSKTATVSVFEGHDVVFEATSPIVSSMRNLHHNITLKKLDGSWKIISDDYEDDLWNMLSKTQKTKEQIINSIQNNIPQQLEAVDSSNTELCSLTPDNSSQGYYREGAVSYAHTYAFIHNEDYYDFTGEGGDCTNFVSQAIHEGGNAPKAFGGSHGIATAGWYYYNPGDRSLSWAYVDGLYNFIVNEVDDWSNGPEGCEIDYSFLQIGDIVQIELQGNEVWDHSLIIVEKIYSPYGPQYLVAAHSEDRDYYPLTEYAYDDIRYIHIERVDGAFLHLPAVLRGNIQIPEGSESYPAPMDSAFGEQIIEGDSSYPAP